MECRQHRQGGKKDKTEYRDLKSNSVEDKLDQMLKKPEKHIKEIKREIKGVKG